MWLFILLPYVEFYIRYLISGIDDCQKPLSYVKLLLCFVFLQCALCIKLARKIFLSSFFFLILIVLFCYKLQLQVYILGDRNTIRVCLVSLVCFQAIKSLPNEIFQTKGHSMMVSQVLTQHKTLASNADNTEQYRNWHAV